ncbi:hypothetical protein [Sphingorhabdus sp. EL138]|uniref:hypothetical protein n=1 Tax=Sphingorhabdus sp. EL138 TaxID=2073156 RepID=UPI0013A57909|nr:hypothetical protein [Sphingorhabdus sp. EL138]
MDKNRSAISKLKLLAGGSFTAAAVALATLGQTAQAQALDPNRSFQATPTFNPGDSWSPGPNTDNVFISGSEAIINWAPLDTATLDTTNTPIDILPSMRSITFNNATDFTVLNRILPTPSLAGEFRPIQFNGTVNTRVNGTQGGSAWFYSPGGIIAGAGSAFNVGSLVLTANDIDTTGGLFGPTGEIRFNGVANSSSVVSIADSATINANTAFSNVSDYVALVAPRVVQGGTVDVAGSAAYVAAEQADLTINNGLFDITVTVGTTNGNGIVHTGTTTGDSSIPIDDDPTTMFVNEANRDAQAIYMVAVPKNAAITMLVGGQVGYRPAATASIINGQVVLSAGYDVSVQGPTSNAQVVVADNPVTNLAGNIEFTGGDFSADVSATASGAINGISTSTGIDIQSAASGDRYDLDLTAGTEINIGADEGGVFRVAGNANLRAGSAANGGAINLVAINDPTSPDGIGEIDIGGNLIVDTGAMGADDFFTVRNNGGTGIGEDAIGGDISVNVSNGGRLQVGGSSEFLTDAQGGKGEEFNGLSQGGNITVNLADNTSSISLLGAVTFDTEARSTGSGKMGGNGVGSVGNDGIAGNFSLNLQGGTMAAGDISINTDARATSGSDGTVSQSNDGIAGNVNIAITGGDHTFNSLSSTSSAESRESVNAAGEIVNGIANRPMANISVSGAGTSLTINNNINLSTGTSDKQVGDAATPSSTISAVGTGTGAGTGLLVAGGIFADIEGSIDLIADGSTVSFDTLQLFATSSFDDGTTLSGGNINVISRNSGVLTGRNGDLFANAQIFDFSGPASPTAVNGRGGNILISADNSSINFTGRLSASANGLGDADLGNGIGGTIRLLVDGDAASMTLTDLSFSTDGRVFFDEEAGFGGFPKGDGGSGIGGTTTIDLLNGTFVADDISVSSDGSGGPGGDNVGSTAGSGGTGTGGDVIVNLDGSNATVNSLTITASGLGGDGGFGDSDNGNNGGNGGMGIGGNATFNATSGTLNVNQIRVDALGNAVRFTSFTSIRGDGGRGRGTGGGDGGAGIGGTATFNLDGTSVVNAQEVLVSTDGYGGEGGSADSDNINGMDIPGGAGGNGGSGTGGSATFNNTTGTISFNQLTVQSLGIGSDGGDSRGVTVGEAAASGGDGGTGTGGLATINLNQDDATNPVYIIDSSGTGGDGGEGLTGGNAGDGIGGVSTLNINNVAVQLNQPTILSNGTGGTGGRSDGIGGNGGNGGDAQGGVARLEIVGAGGMLTTIGGSPVTNSDAFGGTGGGGFDEFLADGGDGGNGGSATGGTVEIAVRTGANYEVNGGAPFTLSSTGTGGQGGTGGYSYSAASGDGGDAGQGTGGTARLLAQGGSLTGNDVTITAAGFGGDAGAAGGTFNGTGGAAGIGGMGAGGTSAIEVQEGSPGIITLGNVNMVANGFNSGDSGFPSGIGGRIEIIDTSTDPAGLITLASLTAEALAGAAPASGFFMSGNSGPITVTGDVFVDVAGNAEFAYDGSGQLVVGGLMDVLSGASILVSHTNNTVPATTSIDVADSFDARAQSDFDAMTGSIINSDAAITIRAEANASAADLRAFDNIDLSAGQNVMLNNASVTGPAETSVFSTGILVSNGIYVRAGSNEDPSFPQFDPLFNATFAGDISSSGAVRIESGGNAVFQTGTNLVSDNLLLVRTGDDIIVQSGASIAAANDPVETVDPSIPFLSENNLLLLAGDIGMGIPLLSTPQTPIASIIAAGNINANDFAVVMTANAIDGLGGTISAGSISADINNAPSNAMIAINGQSDDNGLLSAGCVEGNLCLGALAADNIVQIGQAGVPIQAIIENGDIIANSILVSTRRDIVMGANGVPSRFIASDVIFVNSTEGDVDLRDAELTSDFLGIDAAGSLLGSGSLNSGNDIGITVGGSISAAAIDTGGELTTVEDRGDVLEGFYSVPDSMNVGILTVGAGDVNYDAGGDFSFDQINVPDSNIILDAPGSIFLGSTSGAQNIDINGGDITVGNIDAGVDITLSSGDFIDFGSVDAGNMLDLSGSDITGDVLAAGTTVRVVGTGSLSIGNVISGNETFLEGNSVTLGGADTGDNGDIRFTEGLRIRALDGDINIGGDLDISRTGDFFASGDIIFGDVDVTSKIPSGLDLRALGSVMFGNVTSDSFISVRADGNFTAETVAASSLRVFVDGLIDVTRAEAFNSNFDADLGVEIGELIGGSAVLLSSDGDVAVRNNALVDNTLRASGNNVFLRSDGAMRVIATANAGNIDIVARGNLVVDDANATGNILLTSLAGSAELNELIIIPSGAGTSPAGISSQAVVSANGNIDITAAIDVAINDTVNAANALTITAGNLVDIQALATGTTIDVSSADINIGSTGQLGEFEQTNDIFIESNGINQVLLGGATDLGGYTLDNFEFSRIQSNQDLTIFVGATGNTTPDLIIQDLTVQTGSNVSGPQNANIGFSGTLTIDSGQSTRVDGNLNVTNASAGTTLNMTSLDDLRINANGGLIQITDANGGFGGIGLMTLTAQNIYAMTDQAFADIAGLDVSAVDLRLENSDGLNINDGLIRGGIAEFVVDGDLFIQNTVPGVSFDERRGFTVDTLTINGLSAGSNANIVINGIVSGRTGIDGLLETDVAVTFDDFSTINGCVILDPASCGAPPPPTPTPTPTPTPEPEIDDPVRDVIEEEVTPMEDGSVVSDPFETNLIEIKENEEYIDDPLIDEPVTGAGNDDLWVTDGAAGEEENTECAEGDENCGQGGPEEENALEPAE